MKDHKGKLVLIDVWPFLPTMFDKSTPAAWPHTKDQPLGPLLAYFVWEDETEDAFWVGEMRRALNAIHKVALREGCTTRHAPIYANTALEDVTIQEVYRGNLKKLMRTRAKYDPTDVMGNAGGFRIPLPRKDQWGYDLINEGESDGEVEITDAILKE
jgi:hypothetical protein